MGSLSWETVLHKLLQQESFPQTAVLPKLPQRGSFAGGAVLQEQAAPAWVPHGVTSPASKPAPAWAPLSAWGQSSCQDPAPARALHMVTAPFGHIHLLWCGLQVEICSTVDLHGLQGDSLPHDGFHHGLQVKTLFSSAWSSCSPCIFTDLGVCRVVALTSSHSSLLLHVLFSPILNTLSQRR